MVLKHAWKLYNSVSRFGSSIFNMVVKHFELNSVVEIGFGSNLLNMILKQTRLNQKLVSLHHKTKQKSHKKESSAHTFWTLHQKKEGTSHQDKRSRYGDIVWYTSNTSTHKVLLTRIIINHFWIFGKLFARWKTMFFVFRRLFFWKLC